jgi:hypothetical protein
MLRGTMDDRLENLLLEVARDPELREEVYQHLRQYCHECRNHLNSLKLSLYLAIKRTASPTPPAWAEVERSYQNLETRIEQIHFLCRPIQLSRVTLALDLLMEDRRSFWVGRMADQGGGLVLEPPPVRAVASFDVDSLGRVFDSLVGWRATVGPGGRSAVLRWWIKDEVAHLEWDEPDADPSPGESSAWTLPMLARIIVAHGGDCRVESERGWRLKVFWPAVG